MAMVSSNRRLSPIIFERAARCRVLSITCGKFIPRGRARRNAVSPRATRARLLPASHWHPAALAGQPTMVCNSSMTNALAFLFCHDR